MIVLVIITKTEDFHSAGLDGSCVTCTVDRVSYWEHPAPSRDWESHWILQLSTLGQLRGSGSPHLLPYIWSVSALWYSLHLPMKRFTQPVYLQISSWKRISDIMLHFIFFMISEGCWCLQKKRNLGELGKSVLCL